MDPFHVVRLPSHDCRLPEPNKILGGHMMQAVNDAVSASVPAALAELRNFDRTLKLALLVFGGSA